jgi:hypothetical protein
MEQLYRDVLPLVLPSILLKVELGDARRPSDRRQPNHVALPYYVPWLPRDESARVSAKRFSVCLETSAQVGKGGKQLLRSLRGFPDAVLRASDASKQTAKQARAALCGARRRMRACKFCLVPRGPTPSSRRLYEALAAKCVPVLLSDQFVLPYEGSRGSVSQPVGSTHIAKLGGGGQLGSAGGGLLPPNALDSFVLRVPEGQPAQLRPLLDEAMKRHDAMHRSLLAYRTAYLYELPLDGEPPAGGAVCAVIAEVARRFGPHLHAWRSGSQAGQPGLEAGEPRDPAALGSPRRSAVLAGNATFAAVRTAAPV